MSAGSLRQATTLLLLRDGDAGLEVLMVERVERTDDRSSGAFVFPGGTLDPLDRTLHAVAAGLDDGAASERLGLDANGLDFHVAAIRECFEETGLLLARRTDGTPLDLGLLDAAERERARADGAAGLLALCEAAGLALAVDALAWHSHWLTPVGLPKRFDTRFFVARAPEGQAARPDPREVVSHRWLRPADAVAQADALKLRTPTRRTLQAIAGFASADAAIAHAAAQRRVERICPRIGRGRGGVRPVLPDEFAYAEIGRIDPEGRGHAWHELPVGVPVALSPRVVRVTAPNGGVMTGPGTNSYFVGGGDDWALIDPGPDDAAHVRALLDAAPGRVRWILATHTHVDHSPAARALQAATGATLLGRPAPAVPWHDASFVPERALAHGERLALGGDATLRVVHTPGHASNHLCYLLEEERLLFTGDHVMQGSTVVVSPPDGDMAAYLGSLEALLDEPLDWLAPGHGFLMDEPQAALRRLVRHRRQREAKVANALRELGSPTLEALLERVYDDVPARMHPVAARSLLAHLLKLAAEGRAVEEDGGRWSARG